MSLNEINHGRDFDKDEPLPEGVSQPEIDRSKVDGSWDADADADAKDNEPVEVTHDDGTTPYVKEV